jgi:DNA-binding transcriptional regulator YiaG
MKRHARHLPKLEQLPKAKRWALKPTTKIYLSERLQRKKHLVVLETGRAHCGLYGPWEPFAALEPGYKECERCRMIHEERLILRLNTSKTKHPHAVINFLFSEMKRQGVSRSYLAERTGFNRATVGSWQRGEVWPTLFALETCLNVLGHTMSVKPLPRDSDLAEADEE